MVPVHPSRPNILIKHTDKAKFNALPATDASVNIRCLLTVLFPKEQLETKNKKELMTLPNGKEKIDFIYCNKYLLYFFQILNTKAIIEKKCGCQKSFTTTVINNRLAKLRLQSKNEE